MARQATAAEIAAFIDFIAPLAQKAFLTLGKVRPSVCIAMACCESGYGTSNVMRSNNAFLGQKVGSGKTATKYWQGYFYSAQTKEEYQVGKHTVIRAAFRSYHDTPEMSGAQLCVLNYYELLNTSLYARVKAGASYREQMAQIKAVGYFTSSTEQQTCIDIIEDNNLTRFDFDGTPATPAKNPYKLVINQGTTGDCVKWLQFELNRHGANLSCDGKFGGATFAAVCQYQRQNNLLVDGIVGTNTLTSLKNNMKV